MKVFTFQFEGSKYKEKPQEDSYSLNENTFCVADGITRDPIGVKKVVQEESEENKLSYPNPSPAKFASDLFTQEFLKFSQTHSIEESFKLGNDEVRKLNEEKNPNPDYLENDFWACVAVAASIKDQQLHWGVIGDCALKIFSQGWQQKFETPNSVNKFSKYFLSEENPDKNKFDWSQPERRILIRRGYRNNPDKIINNELVSYGALTGEKVAEKFMYFGKEELSTNDIVILYSDGFERAFEHSEFQNKIRNLLQTGNKEEFSKWNLELAEKDYDNYGHERTMIVIFL